MPSKEELQYLQSLSLEEKIQKSTARIIEWYENWGGQVYVSFSGGKDSTVLLDLVRRIYPDVPAVYSDTGLEYPELRTFVKEQDNVEIIKPEKSFREIVKNYGYPLISKEVAEAIYYARRLGGGKTAIHKRVELQGKRMDSKPMQNEPNCWDNEQQQLDNFSENNLGVERT